MAPGDLPPRLTAVQPAAPAPAAAVAAGGALLPPFMRSQMSFARLLHRQALQLLAPDVPLFHLDGPQLSSLQCRFLLLAMHAGNSAALARWGELTAQQQHEVYASAADLQRRMAAHHLSLRVDVPRLTHAALQVYLRAHPEACFIPQVVHAAVVGRLFAAVLASMAPQVGNGGGGWADGLVEQCCEHASLAQRPSCACTN